MLTRNGNKQDKRVTFERKEEVKHKTLVASAGESCSNIAVLHPMQTKFSHIPSCSHVSAINFCLQ